VLRAPDGYHELFLELLAEPVAALGFELWGKSLLLEEGLLRVAVLRTETRNDWPFQYTLMVGHTCLRDWKDRMPAPPSRAPSDWPIKAAPSRARELAGPFRYEPDLDRPLVHDEMDETRLEEQLTDMADALVAAVPAFPETLHPEIVLRELRRHTTGFWTERRWIEDYERFFL
jgi:hypothetical protein